jgi:hypothetical protein
MNMKLTLNMPRALAIAAVALSLGSLNAFALTQTAPVKPAAAAAAPNAATQDILDIRGPKHIPSPWLWPAWLAGGLALAALGYGAWRWNRRRALATAKLPYEIALDRLEEARALMQPENAREFSITVSEIVRHYIEERFQVRAARRTTEEFLYDLLEPSDALLGSHRGLLADFLHHCDLAKFARWILSIEEMETMLQSARTFVLETGRPAAAPTTNLVAQATANERQQI